MRVLSSPRAPLCGLALLVLVATVTITYWAWRVDVVIPDEMLGVLGSRAILREPLTALQSQVIFPRGLERLFSIFMVAPNAIFGDVSMQLKAAHAMIALAAAAIALPVYAIARELRMSGWWALLAATLAVASPWLMYAETYLNGTLATLTLTTFFYVVVRAVSKPGPWGDLSILLMTVLMSLARTNQIAFFALAPLVIVVDAMRRADEPMAFMSRLRSMPRLIWSEHKTFVIAASMFLLIGGLMGVSVIVGHYSNALPWEHMNVPQLWQRFGLTIASLVFAIGFVPAVFAFPWMLKNVVKPESRTAGAFALVATGAIVMFIVTTYGSVPEERYIAVLVGLLPVAFAAALSTRRIGLIPTFIAAALLGFIGLRYGYYANAATFDIFIGPARIFISQQLADLVLALSPYDDSPLALTLALLSLLAISIALAFWWLKDDELRSQRLASIVGGLAVAVTIISAAWGLQGLNKILQAPNVTYASSSWIDRAAGDQSVGLLQTGSQFELFPSGNMIMHNKQLDTAIALGTAEAPGPCCSNQLKNVVLKKDLKTGALKPDYPPPPLVVVPATAPYGIAGKVLASSDDYSGSVTSSLVRAEQPLRLQWIGVGLAGGPALESKSSAELHVYPLASSAPAVCVKSRVYVGGGDIILSSSPAPIGRSGTEPLPFDTKGYLTWKIPRVSTRETIKLRQEPADRSRPKGTLYLDGTTVYGCR